ncbi:MAG: 1-(5-phosphoribosyl)-5-[(5-phosphoribosylamino)methylideneamino]imidazole-4-carboxamide isomerase [Bacteroidales bacterium]|nr:1-(5-phosphoribosyl)-5-[(5-phosphoribosylamino)methylideneamino]imidazole-4-carboxamide isomerase [Candidatus Cryptobacteroides caccocaballi]
MIEIIPAIDIIGGRCVRLTKGDYAQTKVYDASPVDMAKAYADCGVKRIHLVDLDGAKISDTVNLKTLEKVVSGSGLDVEWGGGIADDAGLGRVFDAGAGHAIIGSVAALHPELFEQWLQKFGPDRMVLGADVRKSEDKLNMFGEPMFNIAVKGWQESVELTIENLIDRFLPLGLNQAIVTDISRDGMLLGPNSPLYVGLQERYQSVDFTVSGGISSMDEIVALDKAGLRKVIIGKAIYENKISLEDIRRWSQNA